MSTITLPPPAYTTTHGYADQEERPIPQEDQYVRHLINDSCFLCGASAPQPVIRYGGMRQLRQQVNRTQHLVSSIKNQTKAILDERSLEAKSWKAKYEKLEDELKKVRQEENVRKAEYQNLKKECAQLRLRNAQLSSLEGEHKKAKRILSLNDNAVQAELHDMHQQNRQLSFKLRERLVEVETLERRLLEEEDANKVWKYKYVGSL
ncbi:hypothetical protein AtubIFM56815_003105 [Aspergillus tubingensis]|uniref:Uncharacterized protein n=1 Tax=Aspergillus tubingensis TaxID=5068 RepID=A0A8H3XX47_ASPTU|nr:uncharacterized protein AtWU_05074 [Aspergillus tubingensis]GFN15273.1 hypothetical protein AtWU_05074 [Aspergillus tubingensis]GLA88646.1 hypothetical protein AtubIFM56815_003105 [Aspergillus tubingensis]GLA91885.1 hypothetical protein AtubIFM57143_006538 [Aspergillus tubingensis]